MTPAVLPAAGENRTVYTQGPSDQNELIRQVRHRLRKLHRVGMLDYIAFTVNGRAVTLEGTVVDPALRDEAERTVGRIAGVSGVINNIGILPRSLEEARIRLAVLRTIRDDSELSARSGYMEAPRIRLVVEDGEVRLEGVVGSELDRNRLRVLANEVPGAFKVVDALQVESKAESK